MALPITPSEGQPLKFFRWQIGGVLEDGPYGTKQPPVGNDECTPDVILAPLLAYDGAVEVLVSGGLAIARSLVYVMTKLWLGSLTIVKCWQNTDRPL